MPKYKEVPIVGTQYTRVAGFEVAFPLAGEVRFSCREEVVTEVGDKVTKVVSPSSVSLPVGQDNREFPIRDNDGFPTSQMMKYSRLWRLLESAYADIAAERDAAAPV